jgi:hypothetical protein
MLTSARLRQIGTAGSGAARYASLLVRAEDDVLPCNHHIRAPSRRRQCRLPREPRDQRSGLGHPELLCEPVAEDPEGGAVKDGQLQAERSAVFPGADAAVGVSKATAVAELAARCGIGRQSVLAFGDMPNDLPLKSWAGASCAVTNAHAAVLAAASCVIGSNDADGVARYLEGLYPQLALLVGIRCNKCDFIR